MNDKDKEAFEKWFQTSPRSTRYGVEEAWQAACEYKDKEIDGLQKVNQDLVKNNVSFVVMDYIQEGVSLHYSNKLDRLQAENKKLREALHQLRGLFLRNYNIGLDYINEALKEVGEE